MNEKRKEDATLEQMKYCLRCVFCPPAILLGLETVSECMRDDTLRDFMGHALLEEIMPSLGKGKNVLDPMAISIVREMEYPIATLFLETLSYNGVHHWRKWALPMLEKYLEREGRLPPCLCLSLASMIMLLSSALQDEDGLFVFTTEKMRIELKEQKDILEAFARLSCDMPPESLAYAALSDRVIWDRDLREIPGLEEKITEQLMDLQLLGLRATMDKAWGKAQ